MKIVAIAITLFFSQASFSNDEQLGKELDEKIAKANKYLKEVPHMSYSTPIECILKTQNLVQEFLLTKKNIEETNKKLERICANAYKITPEVKKILTDTLLAGKKFYATQKDELEIRAIIKKTMAQNTKKQIGETLEPDGEDFKDSKFGGSNKRELDDLIRDRPAVAPDSARK